MPSLREARLQALLSIRQLARRAGIAPTTIYLLETPQRTPQLLTVHKLSQALGIDPLAIDEFRAAYERVSDAESQDEEETAP
jgi:transcriptional regulator with XRE-family HTH domain